MLHLIFELPIESVVLARLGAGDDVIFLGSTVLRLLQTGADSPRLAELLNTHGLYVLTDDIAVRGIAMNELVQGIQLIDYPQFVALTIKHSVIQSWS